MRQAYQALTEERWTPTETGGFLISNDFNEFKPFQKGALAKKIQTGYGFMEKFGIPKEDAVPKVQ